MAVPCGRGTLPDGADCVPLPPKDAPPEREDRGRGWPSAESLPKRPERPADYLAYVLPLSSPGKPLRVSTGASLDARADGVRLHAEHAREAHVVALDNQEGPAEVLFVSEISSPPIGATRRPVAVATKHELLEAGRPSTYVVVYDHLDHVGPGVVTGARLGAGDLLGVAADDAEGEGSELYVEVRKLREGESLGGLEPKRMLDAAISLPCDPRNVFPREAP